MKRKKAPNGRVLANAVTTSKTPDKARKSSCRTVFGDDWNQPPDWDIPDWADESLIRKVIGEGIPPLAVKRIVDAIPKRKKK